MAMVLSVPVEAVASTIPQEVGYTERSPRFTYISDAAITMSSSSIAVMVEGYAEVSKISGTLTLYRINTSGGSTKVNSWNLSVSGAMLNVSKSVSLGNGNFKAVFSGKVTTKNNKSENITIDVNRSF